MGERSVRIPVAVSGLAQVQADLALLADAAESSLEIRNALVGLLGGRSEAACVYVQQCSATAGDLRVELKLSHGLAVLAAALRAGDFDGL